MPLFARALALVVIGSLLLGVSDLPGQSQSNKPATNPNVDSAIIQVLQQLQGGVSAQAAQRQASQMGVSVEGNMLTVVAELAGPASSIISAIAQRFGSSLIRAQSRSFLKLQIPLSSEALTLVLQLADLAGIAYIRPPLAPQALVLSEGVALTGASQLQAGGVRGQGTKIAVIDLGFASLSTAQARGEVPTNVGMFDFTGTGLQNTTSHGTAVAEIIYDMAPNAQLHLMKMCDEVDVENAVDEAIREGVDVINLSVGWVNT
jgi:subtilisin family serine protease